MQMVLVVYLLLQQLHQFLHALVDTQFAGSEYQIWIQRRFVLLIDTGESCEYLRTAQHWYE